MIFFYHTPVAIGKICITHEFWHFSLKKSLIQNWRWWKPGGKTPGFSLWVGCLIKYNPALPPHENLGLWLDSKLGGLFNWPRQSNGSRPREVRQVRCEPFPLLCLEMQNVTEVLCLRILHVPSNSRNFLNGFHFPGGEAHNDLLGCLPL